MTSLTAQIAMQAPVVAAWIATSAALSALLCTVAVLLHRLARGAAPSRVVWGVFLFTTVVITLSQPLRRSTPAAGVPVPRAASVQVSAIQADGLSWPGRVVNALRRVPPATAAAITGVANRAATGVRTVPHSAQLFVVLVWPLASVVLLAIGAWSYRRQRGLLRTAEPLVLHGHLVHVTPASGPAVYGVRTPRIVVPRWLLNRSPDEQRLVIAHEQAHITAHDPALLLSGCMLAALIPWNPLVWYMLSRLRLGIELDCDARVLQSGATPRHYGALLIDLSAAATPVPPLTGATAFSHHASHLERRLRRMTDRPTNHRTTRRFASLSLAAVALAAACGAELPTSAELQGMDVAAAEKRAFVAAPNMTAASYTVDGKTVSESEAKAIAADRIASIEIRKQDKTRSLVRITTLAAQGAAQTPGTALKGTVIAVRKDGTGDSTRTLELRGVRPSSAGSTFEGLLFVDGVKTDPAAMSKIDPTTILNVEVIKGPAAEQQYGAEGAKGVIRITTKKK